MTGAVGGVPTFHVFGRGHVFKWGSHEQAEPTFGEVGTDLGEVSLRQRCPFMTSPSACYITVH